MPTGSNPDLASSLMQQQAPGNRALGSAHDPRPTAAVTIEGVEREQQILEAAHEAGFDLAGLLRSDRPDLKLLFMSGVGKLTSNDPSWQDLAAVV